MLKVALICTESLPAPAIKGGAIQMFIDGVAPFLKEEYHLTIYSINDTALKRYEVKGGIEYIRFPKESYEQDVANHLKRRRFQLIHVFNRPEYLLEYQKASPESRFILGLHNDMLSERKINDEVGEQVVHAASHIVTISYFIKCKVIERFPEAEEKTTVVYSGVDLAKFPKRESEEGRSVRERYRERFGVKDKKVILFVGRLSKNKGPDLLIDAMQMLIKDDPNVILLVVGGKWFSDNGMNRFTWQLYDRAKGIKNNIVFTKFIPADEIGNIFLLGDIFVCPSQWEEPLARVHYEAMAAGIPVVTTNRGGNSEVILHKMNGYLIEDYQNEVAFVRGIQFFINHPEVSSWITENGRKFVEANFQFKHAARRLSDVYKKYLDQ
ncbi:glycosyltransferase family 4 protein [Alteribacter populi]|uniref:glycosyltransferase family 4 protein n=1 Tax=Alteribacter populi TaxID=2011011 RepID=UPI0018E1E1B7|nr:glycosyltransferase family 4 protein [Alteribacter populi]